MNIALPVKAPTMPNFIFAGGQQIAVADLTDAQVQELIDLWAQTFRQHVATKRANRLEAQ